MFNTANSIRLYTSILRRLYSWRSFFNGRQERFNQSRSSFSTFLLFSLLLITLFYPTIVCAATSQRSNPVASVDGKVITEEELEAPLASPIYSLQMQIYELKQSRLDQMIAQMLLQKEADRQGVTLQEFVNKSVLAHMPEVTEQEIEAYSRENQESLQNWKGSDEELKRQIKTFLQQQKAYQQISDYANSLRDKAKVVINLQKPPLPRARVDLRNSPSLGPSNAPLTIIEFSDYRCPSCKQVHEYTKKIKEKYKDRIRWVFKDFPLGVSEPSVKAAEAAHCAGEQSAFWQYQDLLFAGKEEINPEQLRNYAKALKLNVDQFEACMESEKYKPTVMQDIQDGRNAGIDRTPSFIIGDRLFPGGPSYEHFVEMIDKALKEKGEKKR
jgi:protein-disulfide isomerase